MLAQLCDAQGELLSIAFDHGQALQLVGAFHKGFDGTLGLAGIFLLEVNTQPGMTPLSLVPEQARHMGMSYEDLVEAIVAEALRVHQPDATGGRGNHG